MPEQPGVRPIRISPTAMRDIEDALYWSREHFGSNAGVRYGRLIAAAISDIAANPERWAQSRGRN